MFSKIKIKESSGGSELEARKPMLAASPKKEKDKKKSSSMIHKIQ